MKIKIFLTVILALFLFSGCATEAKARAKYKPGTMQNPYTYKEDLNQDARKEIIEVVDTSDANYGALITIKKTDKAKTMIDSLAVPGRFQRIEFIDLNSDEHIQIAVYFEEKGDHNLIIYQLKDKKLTKKFGFSSPYGIEGDFSESVLARVKVGRPTSDKTNRSPSYMGDWDLWVWNGEEFVKEAN